MAAIASAYPAIIVRKPSIRSTAGRAVVLAETLLSWSNRFGGKGLVAMDVLKPLR